MFKFTLSSPIGNGAKSDQDDVRRVRRSLIGLGFDDPHPEFGLIDRKLDQNIRLFQKENDLKVDGRILPGGETEAAIQMAMVRSPSIRCPVCGGPHGGSKGDLCPSCDEKK